MIKTSRIILFVALGLCLTARVAPGIGIYLPDQDSEATARANAFTAKADNPSAVYYNPAGLLQLEGFNLSGTLYGTQTRASFDGAYSVETQQGIQLLPQAYLTWHGTNRPFALGMGVNTPFGMDVDWGNESPMRATIIKDRLEFISVSAVAAYQILPQIAIAAGPVFNIGSLTLEHGLVPMDMGDRIKFEGTGQSWGAVASILFKPVSKLSLGVVYRTSGDVNYDGDVKGDYGTLIPLPSESVNASMCMSIPNQLSLGIGYEITPKLQMEVDAIWTQWSCWDKAELRMQVRGTSSGKIPMVYNWRDSWIFAAGATYELPWQLRAHAGYGYAQETSPNATYSPSIPDSARNVVSLGISKRWSRHIEGTLAYQHIFGKDRTINNGTTPAGTYGYSADAITTSFICHF